MANGAREIANNRIAIKTATLSSQGDFFREAAKAGFPIDVIAAYSKLPRTNLYQWADGTVMPIYALNAITDSCPHFPNELASILTNPGGRVIRDAEPYETDPHEAALMAWNLVGEMLRAQHPDSPGAEKVIHTEMPRIRLAARGSDAAMSKVA